MLKLNLRRGESAFRFGPPSWSTDLEDPIDFSTARQMLDCARVLVLVHGYNVADAFDAYARIAAQVEDLYDVVVGLSWPGSEVELGYWSAEKRADKSGRLLAEIFSDIPYESLDVEGHSCGCRLALEAVKQGLVVRNLILAGAAVDNETVHYDEKYGSGLTTSVGQCIIAYSREDEVLKRAFRLSSAIKRVFVLRPDDCKALGYDGAEKPSLLPRNVSQYDMTDSIKSHSAYKKSPEFYRLWRKIAA